MMEKRWPWFGQARDAVALTAGTVLVGVEIWRGTYDPVGMGFAAGCLGLAAAGAAGRALIGKWESERRPPK